MVSTTSRIIATPSGNFAARGGIIATRGETQSGEAAFHWFAASPLLRFAV